MPKTTLDEPERRRQSVRHNLGSSQGFLGHHKDLMATMKTTFQSGSDQRLVTDLYAHQPTSPALTHPPAGANSLEPPATRGVFLCLHGLGDHAQMFESFAGKALQSGFASAAMDLRGHGRSAGKRGHAVSYDALLDDVSALRENVVQRLGNVPQFLLGHSAGGNIALNYALRRGEFGDSRHRSPTIDADGSLGPLAGLALLSPMLLPPQPVTRPQILAAWLTGYLVPWFRIKKRPALRKITSDPDEQQRIRNDDRRHGRLSIYLATQLLSQGRWAIDHARSVDLRTLLIVGEDDELIDRDAVHHAALRIGRLADTTSVPKGRHDLLHDHTADVVMRRIIQWAQQCC
ncbi:MAG: alpha/beta fold hydrolase [Planctomycetota bacterium]